MSTFDNLPQAEKNEEKNAASKTTTPEQTPVIVDNSDVGANDITANNLDNPKVTTDSTPELETTENNTLNTPTPMNESTSSKAQEYIDDEVAKHSEDESAHLEHQIEKKDYHAMSQEALVKELKLLVKNEKIQAIKEHVEELKTEFNNKFGEELELKKEEFLTNGGNIIDFYYSTPLKKEFNSTYFDYKEKRNGYYQNLKKDLQANLQKRLDLIEELKGLLSLDENINTTYNHFKDIRERWRNAGAIPRDRYNTIWNTFHHHVENFYDFLHLNRDFRDLDFKHNLEQKLKIIDRATELAQETDVNRSFRELQLLHKMWKEDLGPVDKEYREVIWDKFSELTKTIHENRQLHFKEQDKIYEQNLTTKNQIISDIQAIANEPATNHSGWQQKIQAIEKLREAFFKAGKVPAKVNEETWKLFKDAVKDFNRQKNNYYKSQKKEQLDNLHKKQELIKVAEAHKDDEDFDATTPIFKKIQADWKRIGHVPHRDSDKVWKQFKTACNHYFDRIHEVRKEANKELLVNYENKVAQLEKTKAIELSGDTKLDLETIKSHIATWKTLGRIPYDKKAIENEFNKLLDDLFGKLDMSRTETEMIKYENKLNALVNKEDDRALQNEQIFIRKKIDETSSEIRQLENNLQFFKNVDQNNPLVKEVYKNIAKHNDALKLWKIKLQKLKKL